MIVKRSRHHHTKRRGRLQDIPWLHRQCSTTMDPNASNLTFQERNCWLCVKNISIARLLLLKRRQQVSQWTHLVRLIAICGTITREYDSLLPILAWWPNTKRQFQWQTWWSHSSTPKQKPPKNFTGVVHMRRMLKGHTGGISRIKSVCQDAEITNTGLIIDTKSPCLACSPNSPMNIPGTQEPLGIAQYKCPYSLAPSNPPQTAVEIAHNNKKLYCQLSSSGGIELKTGHNYYFQVQDTLSITRRKWCDFVVWSPSGNAIQQVPTDECFLEWPL